MELAEFLAALFEHGRVRVRAIETTGRVLEAIVAVGGNRVERIVLSHQDPLAQLDLADEAVPVQAAARFTQPTPRPTRAPTTASTAKAASSS